MKLYKEVDIISTDISPTWLCICLWSDSVDFEWWDDNDRYFIVMSWWLYFIVMSWWLFLYTIP